MKTFEEAFEKIERNAGINSLVTTNIKQQMSESLQHPRFQRVIIELAEHWVKQVAETNDAKQGMALCCATLQAVFEFGRLVGMEMEKRDDLG